MKPGTREEDRQTEDDRPVEPIDLNAPQHQVQHRPAEVMLFLLGSRYCETDRLSDEAWQYSTRLAAGAGYLSSYARLGSIWLEQIKKVFIDLSKWSNIEAYLARVAARPKVREAMKAEGLLQ
jgi:hypothetical protein